MEGFFGLAVRDFLAFGAFSSALTAAARSVREICSPAFALAPIRQRGRIVQHAINHIFVLFGGKFCGAQRIFPQELRHLLEAHTVAVVGGVLPILVQHHHIRNRQRVSLEICRMVHIECAVDVLQRGASSQRRGVYFRIVGLVHGQTGSLQAVVGFKT